MQRRDDFNGMNISRKGDSRVFWHKKFKYNPDINKEKFPKFIEKVTEIRDEVIERCPLLVLVNLQRKVRTEKLVELLGNLGVLDKEKRVIIDRLQMIGDSNKETVVDELKKMNLRDYSFLRRILKKWKDDLDNDKLDLFNQFSIDIDKFRNDVENWLERMQELKNVREELFLNNMSIVISVARLSKYDNFSSPYNLQDRISLGMMGLDYAIDNFSPDKGASFDTYARGPIMSSIDRHTFHDIWRSEIGRLAKQYRDKQKKFELENGRLANDEEMAEALNVSIEDISKSRLYLESHKQEYRLDSPIGEDEDGKTHKDDLSIGNEGTPEYLAEKKLLKELFWNVVEETFGKNSREIMILKKRAEGKTLESIAQEFNVTRERIRQIEKRAKIRLRDKLKLHGYSLDDF